MEKIKKQKFSKRNDLIDRKCDYCGKYLYSCYPSVKYEGICLNPKCKGNMFGSGVLYDFK